MIPAIQKLDAFDIVGVRNDGGIDLVISCHAALDSSPETLSSLEQKIRNYVREVSEAKAPTFFERYGCAPNAAVRIVVSCEHAVDPEALRVIESMQSVVGIINASLFLKKHM